MKRIVLLISMLILSICIFAQVPQGISYQALVKNTDNTIAASQAVGVQVTILQNGTSVYSETQTVTTDDNGVLSLAIGTGSATEGDFTKIDWSLSNYSLQVAIDPDGGTNYTLSTEQSLLNAPYALYAQNSADAFSRDYKDLKNTPEIPVVPTKISAFENDAKYLTKEAQQLKLDDVTISITDGVDGVVNSVELPKGEYDYYNVEGRPLAKQQGDMLYWDAKSNAWKPFSATENSILTIGLTGQPQWIDKDHASELEFPNCGTLVDIDGNEYKTVIIGTQCWMKENLRVKTTPGGTKMAEITVSNIGQLNVCKEVEHPTMGSFVYYNYTTAVQSTSTNTNQTKIVRGICPEGWHIPSRDEFFAMYKEVDPNWNSSNPTVSNNKLGIKLAAKEGEWYFRGKLSNTVFEYATPVPAENPNGYKYYNTKDAPGYYYPDYTDEYDESGFSSMPFGYVDPADAQVCYNGSGSYWTSISSSTSSGCYGTGVHHNKTGIDYSTNNKNTVCRGVRCICDKEFKDPVKPTVETKNASSVDNTSAVLNGSLTNDGYCDMQEMGFYFGTTEDPAVAGTKITVALDQTDFSTTCSELTTGTKYYFVAFATNTEGTTFGKVLSFTAEKKTDCGTLVDIEGNEYKTTIIGNQCWMAENLRVKTTPAGEKMSEITSTSQLGYVKYYKEVEHPTMGKFVYYTCVSALNQTAANSSQTAQIQGICPDGWYVPTVHDFVIMYQSIDKNWKCGSEKVTSGDAAAKESSNKLGVKLASKQGAWYYQGLITSTDLTYSDVENTPGYVWKNNPSDTDFNSTGFNAMPFGYLGDKDLKVYYNGTGTYWTSITNASNGYSNATGIHYKNTGVDYSASSTSGKVARGVRCVRKAPVE